MIISENEFHLLTHAYIRDAIRMHAIAFSGRCGHPLSHTAYKGHHAMLQALQTTRWTMELAFRSQPALDEQ